MSNSCNKKTIDELTGAAGGTSGSHQRVKPEDLLNLSFYKPSSELLVRFNDNAMNSMKKINQNRKQINKLEQLRDSLLPKLMSGEVRVKV